MKITLTLAIALVLVAFQTQASPVGTVISNVCEPQNRVELTNGVVAVVTSVTLDKGNWILSGGATVQTNVSEPVFRGAYLYTVASFSTDPTTIPFDGLVGLNASPYMTQWFAVDPKPHKIHINEANTVVYLVAGYAGQRATNLTEAFGAISALRVPGGE